MAEGPTYVVKYRRRRAKKTNYKRRLNLIKARLPRVVARRSNKHLSLQLVEYQTNGDKILASAHSSELVKLGWKHSTSNIPAAYLTGLLFGAKVKSLKMHKAVLDLGMNSLVNGSRLYAALKGVVDAGVEIPHEDVVFPSEERLKGEHIANHVQKSKDITKDFDSTKSRILEK